VSEHADVVLERWNKLHEALHRAVVHVDMQVANMQQREALESLWERAECKISLSDLNISRIFQAAPVSVNTEYQPTHSITLGHVNHQASC